MAAGYAIIANGGYRVVPHIVDRVQKQDGTLVSAPVRPVVCDPCPASSADAAPLPERALDAPQRLYHAFHAWGCGAARHRPARRSTAWAVGLGRQDRHDGRCDGHLVQRLSPQARRHNMGGLLGWPLHGQERVRLQGAARHLDGLHACRPRRPARRVAEHSRGRGERESESGHRAGSVTGDPDAVFEYFLEEHMPESSQPASPTRRPGDTRPARPEDVF